MKKLVFVLCFVVTALFSTGTFGKTKKARFYDFSDQLISGEIKKPAAIYGVKGKSQIRQIIKT